MLWLNIDWWNVLYGLAWVGGWWLSIWPMNNNLTSIDHVQRIAAGTLLWLALAWRFGG